MSLPSLSTIGLWTSIGSIYFVGGKTLKNAKNNNILILTRQVADHSRFQAVPIIPIPPTEPLCLNGCWIVAQFQIVEQNQPILIR